MKISISLKGNVKEDNLIWTLSEGKKMVFSAHMLDDVCNYLEKKYGKRISFSERCWIKEDGGKVFTI